MNPYAVQVSKELTLTKYLTHPNPRPKNRGFTLTTEMSDLEALELKSGETVHNLNKEAVTVIKAHKKGMLVLVEVTDEHATANKVQNWCIPASGLFKPVDNGKTA